MRTPSISYWYLDESEPRQAAARRALWAAPVGWGLVDLPGGRVTRRLRCSMGLLRVRLTVVKASHKPLPHAMPITRAYPKRGLVIGRGRYGSVNETARLARGAGY